MLLVQTEPLFRDLLPAEQQAASVVPRFSHEDIGNEYSQTVKQPGLDIDENCFGLKGQTYYSAQVSICRIVCRLG